MLTARNPIQGDEESDWRLLKPLLCLKLNMLLSETGKFIARFRKRIQSIEGKEGGYSKEIIALEKRNLSNIIDELIFFAKSLEAIKRELCNESMGSSRGVYKAKEISDKLYLRLMTTNRKIPISLAPRFYEIYFLIKKIT